MQNPNQSLHVQLHRAQNLKERRKNSDENHSEDREREQNAIAPMSTEMKEVLAGLARFDLLPGNSNNQHSEELILPVINKKQIGSRRSQQVSMRNKFFPSKTHGPRNVESSSRFSGNDELYLSRLPKTLAKPKILIDDIDCDKSKTKQDFEASRESLQRSGRFRSVTYPCKSHVDETKKDELFSKMQSHLLSREKIISSFEESGLNELKIDGPPRRPRAATFPYYHEFTPSEFNKNFASAPFRDSNDLISRSRKASSSSSDKQADHIAKPEGKTTSKDEMSAIINRCEEWFQWREGRRKLKKYR